MIQGPPRHYVDAAGRYLGVFHDAVDPKTNAVLAAVSVPVGAVQVTSAPPSADMKWDAATSAWVSDPSPPAPPDGTTRVEGGSWQVCLGGQWRTVSVE